MTRVQFLVNETGEGPDIFAYFPDMLFTSTLSTCYSHIGQHSACCPEYAEESRPARVEEYTPLLEELILLGYNDLYIDLPF